MLKTLFIGCAGAGSNVVEVLKNGLPDYTFCNYVTVDTSSANTKKDIEFVHFTKDSLKNELLNGSGGVRGANLEDIKKASAKFINDRKLHAFDGIVYLVFSSNGGSGNVIAGVLLKELLLKDVTVCCIMVHDTSSKQYAGQALDTIRAINKIAVETNKAVTTMYFINNIDSKKDLDIKKVNASILEEITLLMAYNDIENIVDIDAEDMKNFYKPNVYTKVKAPAGIYGISGLPIGDITEIVEKHDVIIGRCLTAKEYDPFKGHFLAQHKKGQNIKSSDESMLLLLNNFEKHYTLLENAYKAYDKKIEMFKPGEVDDEDVVEF